MTDQPEGTSRRSVLKASAAGVAGAIGLGSASTAAADFSDNECVRLTADFYPYDEGCPRGDYLPMLEAGTEAQVKDVCPNRFDVELVLLEDGPFNTLGWVHVRYLEHC